MFLLVFGKVIITAVVFWGAGGGASSSVKPPRDTAYDATWVERWAGAFRSSRKNKKYPILAAGTKLLAVTTMPY